MPNSREWALLFWLAVGVAVALRSTDIRQSLLHVARMALGWKVSLPFGFLALNTVAACVAGASFHLWDLSLTTDTLIWLTTAGTITYLNLYRAMTRERFIRRLILAPLQVTLLVEFLVELHVMPLLIEIPLQGVLVLLAVLAAVSATEPSLALVKRLFDGVLALVGLGILAYVVIFTVENWRTLDAAGEARRLILPVWLTLATIPCFFAIGLFAAYESTFVRLRSWAPGRTLSWRVKTAIFLGLNVNLYAVTNIRQPWLAQFGSATGFREGLRVAREYRRFKQAGQPTQE